MRTFIVVVLFLFALTIGFLLRGLQGAMIIGGLGLLAFSLWVFEHYVYVRVPEWRTAAVFNREKKSFSHFLPPGRHFILPGVQYIDGMVNTGSNSTQGSCENALTVGGVPVTIDWSIVYSLDPASIPYPDLRSKMARALPQFSDSMAQSHGNNVLRHIVSQHDIDDFFGRGAQTLLEEEFKEAIQERLKILSFGVIRVMIRGIHVPQRVLEALEQAHERAITTEADARAMTKLQEAISQFSDRDMERLAELERLRLLTNESGGGGLAYMMSTMLTDTARRRGQETRETR